MVLSVSTGVYKWLMAGLALLPRRSPGSSDNDVSDSDSNKPNTHHQAGAETPGNWLVSGLAGAGTWFGKMILCVTESVGLGEILQLLWGLVFRLRPLTREEKEAYAIVDPALLLPLRAIRVDTHSLITKINGGRAVASMYIIHLPDDTVSPDVLVHELAHIRQYEQAGARYMFEALHAQFFGAGYDYGDLKIQRREKLPFSQFNREQQAQTCQDYYRVIQGKYAIYGASLDQLQPYITDYREGVV